jgi:hypothetical protein
VNRKLSEQLQLSESSIKESSSPLPVDAKQAKDGRSHRLPSIIRTNQHNWIAEFFPSERHFETLQLNISVIKRISSSVFGI